MSRIKSFVAGVAIASVVFLVGFYFGQYKKTNEFFLAPAGQTVMIRSIDGNQVQARAVVVNDGLQAVQYVILQIRNGYAFGNDAEPAAEVVAY